jgi:putative tryptophan/tyrosine transport system substrate-binding protein
MRRREFVTLLGGATAAWPLVARAQERLPVVGFLGSSSAWESTPEVNAFRRALGEMGYVDGRNVLIDYRFAEGHYERLPVLAAELVRRPAAVIAAMGTPAAPAVKSVTTTIPTVFRIAVDPVELGLVASYNRPGGNLTGVVSLNTELESKRLEILHEAVPAMTVAALLVNPDNPNTDGNTKNTLAAARVLGIELHVMRAKTEREFEAAFAAMAQVKATGVVIGADPFFLTP